MFNLINTNETLQNKLLYGDTVLGGIEIFIHSNNEWIKINEIYENGPIAQEIKLIKLPSISDNYIEIKFRMSKGYYKIGYAAIVDIIKKSEPIVLQPSGIYKDGLNDKYAENSLKDSLKMLITMPGDKYRLVYVLPELYVNYELFIDSRGYYMEWMREEWLKEENLNLVYLYLNNPLEFFKIHASKYKVHEHRMEELFWSSRYEN